MNNDENLIMDLMPNHSKIESTNKNVQVRAQEPNPPPQLPPRNKLPNEIIELDVDGGLQTSEDNMVNSQLSQASNEQHVLQLQICLCVLDWKGIR